MNILERAKRDIEKITGNVNEFARTAVFLAPTGEQVTVAILHTKHHLGLDAELQKWANAENAHISVAEKALIDLSYPVRGADGEVNFQKHLVTVKDSTDNDVTYRIDQWFPNETIGLITCILGGWENG